MLYFLFFFNDTATTEIYTLSLHDALPICTSPARGGPLQGPPRSPCHGVPVSELFAGIAVADFPRALEWYRRLFGRDADVVAHDREVLWQVSGTGWLYVVEDAVRAGRGLDRKST